MSAACPGRPCARTARLVKRLPPAAAVCQEDVVRWSVSQLENSLPRGSRTGVVVSSRKVVETTQPWATGQNEQRPCLLSPLLALSPAWSGPSESH